MRNRLIITDDNFVFIDVRPMAREFFKCVDLYMYFEHEQSESLIESEEELEYAERQGITIVMEGGHLPKKISARIKWAEAEKIVHEGNIYLRSKDILK
jgi:hypothetical protein